MLCCKREWEYSPASSPSRVYIKNQNPLPLGLRRSGTKIYKGLPPMAAAFINQVPASSYGFDFRYTHGWAFLYRTPSPPRLWQGWGGCDIPI